jgi:Spy/CpxP family protein refolding chaperone
MKKRILIGAALIALAAILASVPYAFAGRRMMRNDGYGPNAGHDGGMMMLGHLRHLRQELDLTDQQVADIQAAFQTVHDQNAPYREQLRGGMKQVAETLLKNPNDLAAAQALVDQQAVAEVAMKKNALAAMSKALQVLSAEQRTKLQTVVSERMNQRLERMERHGLFR